MSHEMIEVFVTEDGDIIVESHGYVGQKCKMATVSLERALGVPGVPQLKTEWVQETHATRQNWEQVMIEIIFDGCIAVLEWWSPEGAAIMKELGSDPSGTIDNPWCG